MGDATALGEALELPSGGATALPESTPAEPQGESDDELLREMLEAMDVDEIRLHIEGLHPAPYGFYEENDTTDGAQALCADDELFAAWGILPASGSFDPQKGDATAEQQRGSQGAGVGAAVGGTDGADATHNALVYAEGDATAEQQHGETMEVEGIFLQLDGLAMASYGFWPADDTTDHSHEFHTTGESMFFSPTTTWSFQDANAFGDLPATYPANPAAIGGDSAEPTWVPLLGIEWAENAAFEAPQKGVDADSADDPDNPDTDATCNGFLNAEEDTTAAQEHMSHAAGAHTATGDVAGDDANDADADATYDANADATCDATAEQQRGSQGAGVGAAVGGTDGADATHNAFVYAEGDATAEQQHGSQGAGAGTAVGGIDGADAGGITITEGVNIPRVLQQMNRLRKQACASGSNGGARPVATTIMPHRPGAVVASTRIASRNHLAELWSHSHSHPQFDASAALPIGPAASTPTPTTPTTLNTTPSPSAPTTPTTPTTPSPSAPTTLAAAESAVPGPYQAASASSSCLVSPVACQVACRYWVEFGP
ncbi:unnamed protein product [Closterium sp. Naga37s-1]|nr:unnamed protein product [Closterium sp. Naga37s-1]